MANYINPNGREAEYDFAKANRYTRRQPCDYNQAVYAQDQDGVCYHFLTVTKAAEAIIQNGYCSSRSKKIVTANCICGFIVRACRGLSSNKNSHRLFGFDWHFVSDIH